MNGTDIGIADLEDRLRSSLRARAESTPVRLVRPVVETAPRRAGRTAGLIGAMAAAVLVVAVAAVFADGGDQQMRTATEGPVAPDASAVGLAPAPRLMIEGSSLWVDVDNANPGIPNWPVQAYRTAGRLDGPMIFLLPFTLDPEAVGRPDGERVSVLGRTAYLFHPSGEGGSASLNVDLDGGELDGGSQLSAVASQVPDDVLVAFVDGLADLGDGRWTPASIPLGLIEVPIAPDPPDGRHYSASVGLASEQVEPGGYPSGDIQVSLYDDGFESRVADRVRSTVTPVEMVTVGGVPSALGAYNDHDIWVLLEPEPGRALELRISNRTRAEVDAILAQARFVDEATWQAAVVLQPKDVPED